MTREVVIRAWCDLGPHDVPEPATESVIEIDGLRREIDICDAHRATLTLAALPEVLETLGRSVSRPGARETGRTMPARGRSPAGRKPGGKGDHVCPFCDLLYGSAFGLHTHIGRDHGVPVGAATGGVLGLFKDRCPLCGETVKALDKHTRETHGFSWGAAYRAALADGDVFGLCGPVEARAQNIGRR